MNAPRVWFSVAAALTLGCGGSSAPSVVSPSAPVAAAPAGQAADEPDVPGGTELLARADAPLSSRFAHINQPVLLRTESVLVTPSGEVLVPKDAVITGQVTARIGERVQIDLERLEMEGVAQPLKARIVGTENGFAGEIHAGDRLKIRLDGPVYSLAAVRARAPGALR
jgi:hypothetical protein